MFDGFERIRIETSGATIDVVQRDMACSSSTAGPGRTLSGVGMDGSWTTYRTSA